MLVRIQSSEIKSTNRANSLECRFSDRSNLRYTAMIEIMDKHLEEKK